MATQEAAPVADQVSVTGSPNATTGGFVEKTSVGGALADASDAGKLPPAPARASPAKDLASAAVTGDAVPLESVRKVVPYPASLTVIRAAGVMPVATGPAAGSVFASSVSCVPVVNGPSADISNITVRGAPFPLLSLGWLTAWSDIISTTEPSAFLVASNSTVCVAGCSVEVDCRIVEPVLVQPGGGPPGSQKGK